MSDSDAYWPKAQRTYVHTTDGTIGQFDSWAPGVRIGLYRLSSGEFVKMCASHMRRATEPEERLFQRARSAKVECVSRG